MKDKVAARSLPRAGADVRRRIDADVAEVSEIHRQLRDGHPDLKCIARVLIISISRSVLRGKCRRVLPL